MTKNNKRKKKRGGGEGEEAVEAQMLKTKAEYSEVRSVLQI